MRDAADLEKLLDPSSIAVIGATETPGQRRADRPGDAPPFGEALLPVHPSRKTVLGIPACSRRSRTCRPASTCAVITVAAEAAVECAERCAERGIPFLVVLAGGFSEAGPSRPRARGPAGGHPRPVRQPRAGTELARPLRAGEEAGHDLRRARRPGRWPPAAALRSSPRAARWPWRRSGLASNIGFGLHSFIGLGNKCDLDELDFLSCFGTKEDVTCVACYLESLEAGRAFLEQARAVSARKPVIVLKAGRTASGAAAVSSHTGRLAGSDRVIGGAFRQYGILRALDDEELCDAARTLSAVPPARGNRMAIVTPAGGYGVMCADAVESHPPGDRPGAGGARSRHPRPHPVRDPPVRLLPQPRRPHGERGRPHVRREPRRAPGGSRGRHRHLHRVLRTALDQRGTDRRDRRPRVRARRSPILVFTQYGPFTDGHLRRFYDAGVIGFPSIARTVRAASFLVERAAVVDALGGER